MGRLQLLVALSLLVAAPMASGAQRNVSGARLEILLPADNPSGLVDVGAGPRVAISGVLRQGQVPDLMRNGFPARVRARLELWRVGGWFDESETTVEWDVIVGFDPSAQLYRMRRRIRERTDDLGAFATLAEAEAALERPFGVPLLPKHAGRRYYYQFTVEVEALSLGDLDELERWLRGDLEPAVRGRGSPLAAIGRGTRRLVIRVLGGERRKYDTRSAVFRPARGAA